MRLGSTHVWASSHLIMSRVNWTSSTLFVWAPWQQYPTFHPLPPFDAESGNTAMQPTLSHLVPQPDAISCRAPVPPSGWKSNTTGSGELPVYPVGRWTMNVRDAPLDVIICIESPALSVPGHADPASPAPLPVLLPVELLPLDVLPPELPFEVLPPGLLLPP